MEVQLAPDVHERLARLANESGCKVDEIINDALPGYLDAIEKTREMLDSRYDDLKSGRVKPVDGEAFFEELRRREEALLKPPAR